MVRTRTSRTSRSGEPRRGAAGVSLLELIVVLMIIAGLKANDGVAYRYPFTIRFIK